MINQMATDNVRLGRVAEEEVVLSIKGNDVRLTIDELNELNRLTEHYWQANNFWQYTKEAKDEMARMEQAKMSNDLRLYQQARL